MDIIKHDFPKDQYYQEVTKKKSICIHHTVSGKGVIGDISWWEKTKDRVATHYIIDREGGIHKMFAEVHWGHHLGIKSIWFQKFGLAPMNNQLNKETIGIELDSWGWLTQADDEHFENWMGEKIDDDLEAHEYPNKFRGHQFYEKYTEAQLESLRDLLIDICVRQGISNVYNPEIWDISKDALSGAGGIWSHTSYRADKTDCHPQEELKNMLSTLILSGITGK